MPSFLEIAAIPAEIPVILYEAGEIDYFAKHKNPFLLITLDFISTSGSEHFSAFDYEYQDGSNHDAPEKRYGTKP